MPDFNTPPFILAAVKRLYPDMPDLVGTDAWASLQPQVDSYIGTLEAQPDAYLASTQLYGLLAQHEAARQRLSKELIIQETVANSITASMKQMGVTADDTLLASILGSMTWDVEPETVPSAEEREQTKGITLKDGGVSGGISIKFKNLDLDLGKMMMLGAGFFVAGQDMLDKPSPFMLAGGVLVLVGTLLSEMTVKIEQQDATVFWSFIVATNNQTNDRQATSDAIFTTTNAERTLRGLPELTHQQFDHSLYKLVELGSIARVDANTYRIVEKFKVKN